MSDDSGKTKKLSLSDSKLTLGTIDASKLRAGSAVGAGRKTVQVEVRRKRAPAAPSRSQIPGAVEPPAYSVIYRYRVVYFNFVIVVFLYIFRVLV